MTDAGIKAKGLFEQSLYDCAPCVRVANVVHAGTIPVMHQQI